MKLPRRIKVRLAATAVIALGVGIVTFWDAGQAIVPPWSSFGLSAYLLSTGFLLEGRKTRVMWTSGANPDVSRIVGAWPLLEDVTNRAVLRGRLRRPRRLGDRGRVRGGGGWSQSSTRDG